MSNFSEVQVSIDDTIKIFKKTLDENAAPYQKATIEWCNAKLEILRSNLNEMYQPNLGLPANTMRKVVATFAEGLDFDSAYASPLVLELMRTSEEDAAVALAAYDFLLNSPFEELVAMGPLGVSLMTERIDTYTKNYLREVKYAEIYSKTSFKERMAAVNDNLQLLQGTLFPPGMSKEGILKISQRSMAIFTNWITVDERNIRVV